MSESQALATVEQPGVFRTAFQPTSQGNVEYQAKLLATATVIPQLFRNNLGNVMIAMDFALRLGMSPFSVMTEMYEVKGKPQFSGKFMAAIVVASGQFERLRYTIRRDEKNNVIGCAAYTKELSTGNVITGTEITWEMVTGEGWDKNAKWKNMREQMFKYRAATFWVRAETPDLALGIQTQDELADMDAADTAADAESPDPDLPSAADAYRARQIDAYQQEVQPILDAMKHEENPTTMNKHYTNAIGVWENHLPGEPFDDEVAEGYRANLQ